MNKYYPTKKIDSAWLVEVCSDKTIGGIKNIIGITVDYSNEKLFYSIFDDCFFRVLPSKEELDKNYESYYSKIYVEVYDKDNQYMKSTATQLYEGVQKDFLTKEEITANIKFIAGYFSDLDYELEMSTQVDYENPSTIDENIITSEPEYRMKKKRPITYDKGHIYGPKSELLLKKNTNI